MMKWASIEFNALLFFNSITLSNTMECGDNSAVQRLPGLINLYVRTTNTNTDNIWLLQPNTEYLYQVGYQISYVIFGLIEYSRLRLIEPPRDQVVLTRLSGETD